MKKTVVILVAIAVLGLIGIADKTQGDKHQLVTPSQSSVAATLGESTMGSGPAAASTQTPGTKYRDGTYIGANEPTPFGTVQMAVVVSGGRITDVHFLQMPSDQPESRRHTADSEPLLKQTTLAAQSANIDFVSGATDTSYAFEQSLQAALNQAALKSAS